jgi:hypothetical protein
MEVCRKLSQPSTSCENPAKTAPDKESRKSSNTKHLAGQGVEVEHRFVNIS